MGVPWRSVHPQTDHATFRPKLSIHPTNRLLWQFTTVTFIHLYDPSMYFSSTPPSRWTVCHLWHNVHPPQNALWHHVHLFLKQNLDGLSQHFGTHLWPPASCLATCGCFVTGLFPNMFAMSSRLFSEVWTFYRLIFGHLWCPAHLLSKLWTFCHRIYEKSKKSHETVPLRIRCHTWKWKMDLLSRLDEMSQQSWTKNTQKKCHRLWDKIVQWDGLSHCDKPSKFTRSESHNFGWTDNPSTLRRNVTVVKCHSRRFVRWTNSVGRNVTWSVCGWTDRQCTGHGHALVDCIIAHSS